MEKTVEDIRKNNLEMLASQYGTPAALADKADTNPRYISEVLEGDNEKGMGDLLARQIEKNLNLEFGWMDTEHEPY